MAAISSKELTVCRADSLLTKFPSHKIAILTTSLDKEIWLKNDEILTFVGVF